MSKTWTDLMVDIETLSTGTNAVILSIGAVPFNIKGKGKRQIVDYASSVSEQFVMNISIDSCQKAGLTIDESTLLWWMGQSKEAINMAFHRPTASLGHVLFEFKKYIQLLKPSSLKIWGNSARFDLGIIENAYIKTSNAGTTNTIPWKYSKERDVRTLVNFHPELKTKMKFEGIQHDPIDDCIHQIKYCTKIYNKLEG